MQKFNYTPTNPFSGSLSSLAIGAGMVIVPLVYPFGIRIGRMPILGATATTVILPRPFGDEDHAHLGKDHAGG